MTNPHLREVESALSEPWQIDWPADGLETVEACPVCEHTARRLLHAGLVDNTFRTAPGRWTMWRCAACLSGYLSPRPTESTILKAYLSYYTHHATGVYPAPAPMQRLRALLANGYANWRYGAHFEPASRWGVLVAMMLPARRATVDCELRHLPPLSKSGGCLLDVGCGDGSYLKRARSCGWHVLGLEPDAKAAMLARQGGVAVIDGGLEKLEGQSEAFEVITLSHVIEHMHAPRWVLGACYRLLKPGGQLWIQTPHVDALGREVFGMNWRGMEAPRHLVLFSARGLNQALREAGFASPETLRSPSPRRGLFEKSQAISEGRWPDAPVSLPSALKRQVRRADFRDAIRADRCEFLTVRAIKPGWGDG